MNIVKVHLRLLTPAVLGGIGTERGMLIRSSSKLVPPSTFLGALLKAFGAQSDTETALNVYATPLIPKSDISAEPLKDVLIAHALSFKGKGRFRQYVFSLGLDEVIHSLVADERETINALASLVSKLWRDIPKLFKGSDILSINPADVKPAQGIPIEKTRDGLWREVKVKTGVYIENAVDRLRGSARAGILYGYEYIVPGTEFVGYVACSGGVELCDKMISEKSFKMYIGKGEGRGFGKATVTAVRADIPCSSINRNVFALLVLSPSYKVDGVPRPIQRGDRVETASGLRLEVLNVIGRGVEVYAGWSRYRSAPRLAISAVRPGSIVVAKSESGIRPDECRELCLGMVKGGTPGFNSMYALAADPIPTVTTVTIY